MSKLKKIKGKVIEISKIPKNLIPDWLLVHRVGAYVECHIDDDVEDKLSKWLIKEYPSIEINTFFIEIDI